MGEQTMETQKKVSLTKKDLNKAYWTFETYAQACCSYERLQAPGFFSGMRNIIDKLYDDDPEQKAEACQRHMEFYNSEFALVGPVILGAAIAMEEEKANGADIDGQAISAIKTSLMGPLAGIGDTIYQGVLIPILLAICIDITLTGTVWGAIVYLILMLAISYIFSFANFFFGYQQGSEAIMDFLEKGLLDKLLLGAQVMGCMVMGGLITNYVKVSCGLELVTSGSKFNVQTQLFDAVMPGILPFGFTMLVYWLMKKRWTSIKIIILIVIIGIIGGLTGILA